LNATRARGHVFSLAQGNYVRNDGSGEESMITIQVYMSESSVGMAERMLWGFSSWLDFQNIQLQLLW
jgi:hypothetical protein